MTRNLKVLGLAALAMLALGATIATTAQAEPTLTSGKTSPLTHTATAVHAVQYSPNANLTDNSLTTTVGTIGCSNGPTTFAGSTTGTDKTLTMSASYVHCTTITAADAAGAPVTITMNGCDYLVTQLSTIGDGSGRYTGSVNLVCPEGKKVEIDLYASGTVTAHSVKVCTVSVSETKNLSHVLSQNKAGEGGAKDDITITATVSGIPYATSGICGASEGNATFTSYLTLTSTNHDLWLSD